MIKNLFCSLKKTKILSTKTIVIRTKTTNSNKRTTMASKLTEEQREQSLKGLFSKGWSITKDRDALHKEFLFKDFNQVKMIMTQYLNSYWCAFSFCFDQRHLVL
jgi:hypothetical protein